MQDNLSTFSLHKAYSSIPSDRALDKRKYLVVIQDNFC